MKQEQDYIQDIAAIRSMMERSSKFLSLSGWSGVLAGVYALIGAGVAYFGIGVNAGTVFYSEKQILYTVITAISVLLFSVITSVLFARRKAVGNNQTLWNPIAKKLVAGMGVPLITGGLLIITMLKMSAVYVIPATSLIFYGLALFNAGSYTFKEIKALGILEIVLGLASILYIEYSVVFWALGFGVMHIIYGAYIHFKYER